MASDKDLVDYIVEQMEEAGEIRSKKMFGEYAIYCNGKVVALICDNRLLVRPTDAGRAFIGQVEEDFPYPGAKPHFLIRDGFEDREWITELIRITAKETPEPKPKRKSAGREGL